MVIAYDLDLRLKVIDFIENGGGITKASKTFKVGRATIYRWLGREELAAKKVESRQRKINIKELEEDVKNNPDTLLKERFKKFCITSASLCYQFKKMKITRKKQLLYQEREAQKRAKYQKILRQFILVKGIESLVFINEAGFEEFVSSLYGWSKKGEKIYGEKQGKKENLVAGRRKTKKDLIAPMLFTGSLNVVDFEGWLEFYLTSALTIKSILIMDNASIHRKNQD